jgi:uncharacterized damage-inducible protein DinB
MITTDLALLHFDFTAWASQRLVLAAASLTEEELTRDFKHADKSVLGTLVHAFAADRVWLGRVTGVGAGRFIDPEKDMHLAVLQTDWPAVHAGWTEYLKGQTNESLMSTVVAYTDLRGNTHQTPLWQIVLHVVNHASHHRGQVSAMLRAMGHTPPGVDLIFYYREKFPLKAVAG